MMILSDVSRMVLVLLLLVAGHIYHVYAVGFLLSVFGVVSASAAKALLPNLAQGNLLMRMNSVLTLSTNILQVIGPAVAGFVVGRLGVAVAFSTDASTFLASAVILFFLRSVGTVSGLRQREFWKPIKEGVLYIARSARARTLTVSRVIIALGAGMLQVVLIVFIKQIMGGGTESFGLAMSAIAVGSVTGAALLTIYGHRLDANRLFSLGTIGVGLSFIGLATAPHIVLCLLILVADGLADSCVVTSFAFLSQRSVPDELRGRFFSTVGTLFRLAMLVATGLGGISARVLGIKNTVALSGVVIVLAGAFALISFARERNIEAG